MTHGYLRAVSTHLTRVRRADRLRALDSLAAQLDELTAADLDPVVALGTPDDYAAELRDALASDEVGTTPLLRMLGVPIETRGWMNAEVRSRTWDPANPRIVVPRLFGAGWTLNLGALAVKLRLIRPDDATHDVLDLIPERAIRAAQSVPLVAACATTASLALLWRHLPAEVPSRFDLLGRSQRLAPKRSLLGVVALGIIPALWAARRKAPTEDRLVRAASATTLATVSASVLAATALQARRPRGRWGLIVLSALPAGVGGALAVVVIPLRVGLRRAWRTG